MARAIRASASSAVIVHSEKEFDSRKLDEGRMAHPSIWDAPALQVQLWTAQICSLHAAILHARRTLAARPRLLAGDAGVSALPGSPLEVPGSVPLRIDPDERRCAAALLAAKADVADEGVPADASAAEEWGNGKSVIRPQLQVSR